MEGTFRTRLIRKKNNSEPAIFLFQSNLQEIFQPSKIARKKMKNHSLTKMVSNEKGKLERGIEAF